MSNEPRKRIIVVEDDDDFRETLLDALSSTPHEVCGVASVKAFQQKGSGDHFDLAIVDVNLPDGSGFAVVRSLRESSPTKIIVLTGRDTVADRVEGYTHGADIYMVKPTSEAELLAAAEALLRRAKAQTTEPAAQGWRLHESDRSLQAPGGERVKLSIRQSDFMKRLMRTPGKAVTRNELRKAIGLDNAEPAGRALDMFVARLRRDIEAQVNYDAPIETVPRIGFAFRRV